MEDKPDGSHLRTLPDGSIQRRIKHFLLWPKPYDFGVFPNIARGIAEIIQESAPELVVQYFWLSMAKVFPGLTKPTLLSPIIDLARNKNFKDGAIIPYYRAKGMYQDALINSNTRFSAMKIAEAINEMYSQMPQNQDDYDSLVSPILVDYLISNYFVGLASYLPDIAEAMFAWDDEAYGPIPKGRIDENDIINNVFSIITRRFFAKSTPTKFNENISKLYEIKAQAKKIELDVKNASDITVDFFRNKQNIDIDRVTREALQNAYKVSHVLADGLVTIQTLRKLRNSIQFKKFDENGILFTAESKRAEIDRIQTEENRLAYNIMNNIINLQDPTFLMSIFGTKLYKEYARKNIKTRKVQKWFANIQRKIFD